MKRSSVTTMGLALLAYTLFLDCVLQAQKAPGTPQARLRDELDNFGLIVEAEGPLQIVRRAEDFLYRYPESEFREKVLELEFDAFKQQNDYPATRRTGMRIVES